MVRKLDHAKRKRVPGTESIMPAEDAKACLSTSINQMELDLFRREVRDLLADPVFTESFANLAAVLKDCADMPASRLSHGRSRLLDKAKRLLELRKRRGDDWDSSRPAPPLRPFVKRPAREIDMGAKPLKPPVRP